MPTPVQHFSARRFVGLDLFHDAGDIGPGYLTLADNLFVDGGSLRTRPGKVGQFAAPLGSPLYAPLPFLNADGSTAILFSGGGKLYQARKGSPVYAEILSGGASFGLNSPAVRMARLGGFAYVVDGAGPLARTDLATGGVVQALGQPVAPVKAALASQTILSFSSLAQLAPDVGPSSTGDNGAERIVNSSGWAGIATGTSYGSGTALSGGWTSIGPDVDWHSTASGPYMLIDNPGEGVVSTSAVAVPALTSDSTRRQI